MNRTCKFISWIAALAVLSLLLASPALTRADIYVDANNGSDATGDGSAANPYQSLQYAIIQANATTDTIHLADGDYTGNFRVSGKDLTIMGTPAGPGVLDMLYNNNPAVLDGSSSNTATMFVDSDATVTLSGLTIAYGFNFNNEGEGEGGGVENLGTVTLSRCLVYFCFAPYGGGIGNEGTLNVDRCLFFYDNIFALYQAFDAYGGGAVANGVTNPGATAVISNSLFLLNFANLGGAVYNGGLLTMANCGMTANYALTSGGVLANEGLANLYNCTSIQNGTYFDGGTGGAVANTSSASVLNATNTILYGDFLTTGSTTIPNEIDSVASATVTLAYSDIQGGPPPGTDGGHNIDADPLFDNNNGLLSLTSTSPCVNAGDNSVVTAANGYPQVNNQYVDLVLNPRIVAGTVDMGTTEFQSWLTFTDVTVTPHGAHHITVTTQINNPNADKDLDVTVTAASLGGTDTISILPIYYGTIKSGNSKLCTLQFTDIPSGDQTLTITGTSSLGAFFTTQTVTVP